MDRAAFESEVQAEGYEVVERHMEPNVHNAEHTHDFDARLLMLGGALTLTIEGKEHTYRAGDTCAVPLGCVHIEQFGPEGAHYLAGRRFPAKN